MIKVSPSAKSITYFILLKIFKLYFIICFTFLHLPFSWNEHFKSFTYNGNATSKQWSQKLFTSENWVSNRWTGIHMISLSA